MNINDKPFFFNTTPPTPINLFQSATTNNQSCIATPSTFYHNPKMRKSSAQGLAVFLSLALINQFFKTPRNRAIAFACFVCIFAYTLKKWDLINFGEETAEERAEEAKRAKEQEVLTELLEESSKRRNSQSN